jgi:hypothetical protein
MTFNDANGWNAIDLSIADTNLDAGDYVAEVDASAISKEEVLWFKLELTLVDNGYVLPPMFTPLAAKPGSKHIKRVPEGARLLRQLARAAGVTLPRDLRPGDLAGLFKCKRVRARCAVQQRDGFTELVMRSVMPLIEAGSGE